MTGLPLPPGRHELRAVADVNDNGHTIIRVSHGDGTHLATVEGRDFEFRSAAISVAPFLTVKLAGRG